MKNLYLLTALILSYGTNLTAQNITVGTITTIEDAFDGDTTILIATDGMPIISYNGTSNASQSLNIYKCNNLQCTNGGVVTVLDSNPSVGSLNSMTLGMDGLPIIVYNDAINHSIKVVKCTSVDCSSFITPITLQDNTDEFVGDSFNIVIGHDGNPVISYFSSGGVDILALELKVLSCTTPNCSAFNQPITVYDQNTSNNSLAIGADGNPVLSFFDGVDLRFIKCTSSTCSTFQDSIVLDNTGFFAGENSSIAIGASGNPIISYYHNDSNDTLKFINCLNTDCSQSSSSIVLDDIGDVGLFPSMVVDINGNPIISYFDFTSLSLKLIKCTSIDCSTFSPAIVADQGDIAMLKWVGENNSLVLGSNGNLFVSYFDKFNQKLKILTATHASVDSEIPVFKNGFEQE
ncbi:hypothetical protein MNBD_GAMMA03-1310 [hydrothermal vent metagenome]|uniref:Uncharacterized protein n=1 Tax=hydrothermal vent metagenome TaxID=652676 RepID=A0A3B0WBH8_9ZZZZ